MIDWLLNDVLWGEGQRGPMFDRSFSWGHGKVIVMPPPRLYSEILGALESVLQSIKKLHVLRNGGLADCCT